MTDEMFKSFFGEDGNGSIDYATFTEALNKSGMKLADINKGEYVSKAKYDKTLGEFTKYKADNDVSKYADYEELKAKVAELENEKAEAEMMKEISKAKVDEKFSKFVLSEVKPLVTDKKDFASCLKDYLEQNPQFVVDETQKKTTFKMRSNTSLEGGNGSGKATTDTKMNNILRGVRKV